MRIPPGWLTATDVAKVYRVSVAYARKMAHKHQWRRCRFGRHVGYHIDDVDRWRNDPT